MTAEELGEYARFRYRGRKGHQGEEGCPAISREVLPFQRRKGERYVSISVGWLRWVSGTSSGKSAILTALILAHVGALTRKSTVEVKSRLLKEFGLTRQAYYRGLRALEAGGVVRLCRRRSGKRLVVKLLQRLAKSTPEDS